jgi:hypothetical protein
VSRRGIIALPVGAFIAYAIAAVPGVDWLDSGELVAGAFALGVSHPPGQPTYTLLGKLASLLPLGEVAFRASLLSAACAALAVAGAIALAHELLDADDWRGHMGALVAAALLAASPMLWEQAVRPEVYAPMAAAGVWGATFLVRFSRREPRPRDAVTAALLLALAAGIHPLLAAVIAFAFAPAILWRAPRSLLLVLAAGILGLGVNLVLPARANARVVWAEPATLGGMVDIMLGRVYAGNFQLAGTLDRAVGHVLLLGEGTSLPILVCGTAGLLFGAVTRLRGALPLLVAAATVVVATSTQKVFYPQNPDVHGYLLAGLPLLAAGIPLLFAAAGRALAGTTRLTRALGVGVVALPVMVLAATGRTTHIDARSRRDDDALRYYDRTLGAVPVGPAVLVTDSDHALFVSQYEKVVAGARPDVGLAHEAFLKAEWAARFLKRDFPTMYVPFIDDAIPGSMVARLVRGNLARGFPVWSLKPDPGGLWATPVDGTLAYDCAPRAMPGPAFPVASFGGDMGRRVAQNENWKRATWELHARRFDEALRAAGAEGSFSERERRAVAAIPADARPVLPELRRASPIFFYEDWQLDSIVREVRFLAGLPEDPPAADAAPDVRLLYAWHLLLRGDARADAAIGAAHVDARAVTARMLFGRGRDADGEAQLRACIAEQPDHDGCVLMLASYLGNHARLGEAEALLRRLVARRDHPRGYAELGLVLAKQNRTDEAIAMWKRSLAIDALQFDVDSWLRAAQAGDAGPTRSAP